MFSALCVLAIAVFHLHFQKHLDRSISRNFTLEDSRVLQDLINDDSLSEDMELSDPVSECPLPVSIETGDSGGMYLISKFRKALDGESIETYNRCQERWFNMSLNWTSINDIDEETETRF